MYHKAKKILTQSALLLSVASLFFVGKTYAVETHYIQKGDTIYSISKRYGLTPQELKNINGLSSDWIEAGSYLIISKDNQTEPSSAHYTVQKGDTLYSIANRYGVTVTQLKALNGLTSNVIEIGTVLKLSGQAVVPTPTDKSTQTSGVHTVQAGDSLSKIGSVYGMTVQQLKDLNGLTSDFLNVGDQLKISGTSSQVTQPAPPSNNNAPVGSYIVNSGDSLSTIALAYGVSVDQLRAWNGLVSDLIYPGDKIAIQATGQSQVSQGQASRPSATGQGQAYTIQSGESFDTVARSIGMTGYELMAYNGLNSTMLYPGDTIYLPSTGNRQQTVATSTQNTQTSAPNQTTPQPSKVEAPVSHEKPASPKDEKAKTINLRRPTTSKNKKDLTDPQTKALDPSVIDLPIYEVKADDKLAEIAKNNQVDEKDLRDWNSLLNDQVNEGDKLYLKDPSQAVTVFSQVRPLEKTYPVTRKLTDDQKIEDLEKIYPVKAEEIRTWSKLEKDQEVDSEIVLTLTFPDKNPDIHKVEEEDSIASIAEQYEVSVEAIRAWNGLMDNVIYIGEELAVTNPWVTYHNVEPGETLEVLADKYQVSIEDLRKWNDLPEKSMIVNGILYASDPKDYKELEKLNTTKQEENQETSQETTKE